MAKYSDSTGRYAVLLQYHYGVYTAGSTISLFGMWAHKLAVAWLAWELTKSSFWVAVVADQQLKIACREGPHEKTFGFDLSHGI